MAERLGVDGLELAELERIIMAKMVSGLGFALRAFFALTLVSNWSEIADTVSGLDWVWVVPIVIVILFGTVGGAMPLSGSVIRPIALGEATIIMFGQSFISRFNPMNAAVMAMRIRYLQRGVTDGTVATAAIGLTSPTSDVIQVLLSACFVRASSSDQPRLRRTRTPTNEAPARLRRPGLGHALDDHCVRPVMSRRRFFLRRARRCWCSG